MDEGFEAQAAVARVLMEKIRHDNYPSTTHMQLVEQVIPKELVRDYLNILLEKALMDNNPSIPMLRRIVRVAHSM
jgi:hypothetical protein